MESGSIFSAFGETSPLDRTIWTESGMTKVALRILLEAQRDVSCPRLEEGAAMTPKRQRTATVRRENIRGEG
jgi:hypothetical protein